MLQGLLILYLVSFVLGILVVVRIWRANTLDGVLTLFIPGYALYALYKYWSDRDHDIRYLLLAQFVIAGLLVWSVFRIALAVPATNHLAIAQEDNSAADEDSADAEQGSAGANRTVSTSAPDKAALTIAAMQAPPAPEPATEAEPPPRRATPAELKRLAETVTFERGSFTREAIGMHFAIPRGEHLLGSTDARRFDTALRGENDAHLIGLMIEDNKTLTDANLHIVRLRWRHDGLVAPNPAPFDPTALLDGAHTRTHVARLSSSGGSLLRYDTVPVREGSVVVWSEERQLDGDSQRVYDCHALRLARKGVLELSLLGADAKAAKSCPGELRALAASVQFEPDSDYPAQTEGERIAPYSLGALIAQTQ
jgi:hypothetical protein